jgi:hypothetical protein
MISNEAGIGVLRLYDAQTRRERPKPAAPIGTVKSLQWHHDSGALAFVLDTAQTPGDVYVLDRASNAVSRWTASTVAGLDASAFRSPQPIRWTSFDGREIAGFITRPPPKFAGRRPVMIQIHGGPEAQARPGFRGRSNYFIDELGIAIISPMSAARRLRQDVRFVGRRNEARGFGPGHRRAWTDREAPDLDEAGDRRRRKLRRYMTAVDDLRNASPRRHRIGNFVIFLERTESYQRDLRRVEYGDERDPAMRVPDADRAWNNAAKITRPLFVAHNDRAPYTEAERSSRRSARTARRSGTCSPATKATLRQKENADFTSRPFASCRRRCCGSRVPSCMATYPCVRYRTDDFVRRAKKSSRSPWQPAMSCPSK